MSKIISYDTISTIKTSSLKSGLIIKTGIRAGDWACRDCQGTANGSTLTKAQCASCFVR